MESSQIYGIKSNCFILQILFLYFVFVRGKKLFEKFIIAFMFSIHISNVFKVIIFQNIHSHFNLKYA